MNAKELERFSNYIESTHHFYLKKEIPRLSKLMEEVTRIHGGRHFELIYLRKFFDGFASRLERETAEETRHLIELVAGLSGNGSPHWINPETLRRASRDFLSKRSRIERSIQQLKTLSQDFTPPVDTCQKYRALFSGLQDLSRQLQIELNLERALVLPLLAAAEENTGHKEAG